MKQSSCKHCLLHAKQVGRIQHVSSAEEMRSAAQDCNQSGYMVMDCSDWQIIPAENLVAAFQVLHRQALMYTKHINYQC